jgi:hypothetical protein
MENQRNPQGSQQGQESMQRNQNVSGGSQQSDQQRGGQQAEQRGQNMGQQGGDSGQRQYQSEGNQGRMPHGEDVDVNESDTQRMGRDQDMDR